MAGTDASVYSLKGKRVYVAGHTGMAGSAIVRRLASEPCDVLTRTRYETDLLRQAETERAIAEMQPDVVVFAAGRVGGIKANAEMPVEFLTENLAMALNVVQASFKASVKRLLFLGSTCIYPRL